MELLKTKTKTLLLAMICSNALVSCGGNNDVTTPTQTNTSSETAPITQNQVEETTPEPIYEIEFQDIEEMTTEEVISEIDTMEQDILALEEEIIELEALEEEVLALEEEIASLESLEAEIAALEAEISSME